MPARSISSSLVSVWTMPVRGTELGISVPKRHSDLCRAYRGSHVVDLDCLFEPLDPADAEQDRGQVS